MFKYMLILFLFLYGCSQDKLAIAKTDRTQDSSLVVQKESKGDEKLKESLGVATLMGIIFLVAPKEAYR